MYRSGLSEMNITSRKKNPIVENISMSFVKALKFSFFSSVDHPPLSGLLSVPEITLGVF